MLSGNLAEFPLSRLLETLMGAARGGALCIEPPGFVGVVYLEGGHPVHAQAGPLQGLEALEFLTGLRSAPFRFDAEQRTQKRSIEPGLSTHRLILHQFEAWKEIDLPDNWQLLLQARSNQGYVQLSPLEASMLARVQGKSLAQALMDGQLSPLEAAQVISKLLRLGLLEARMYPQIQPKHLVVLTLYGGGQGVAAIDVDLFTNWQGLLGEGFVLRVRSKAQEVVLRPESRFNMQGRLGLFERDLRQLRLSRGVVVEVWPEAR